MTVVDLHPEDLIDKLSDGELTALERARLESHLAQCLSCRFEISVRADLTQDAPPVTQRPLLAFSEHAQTRARTSEVFLQADAQRAPRARVTGTLRSRSSRRWPLALLAASFILCAGGAAAAVFTGVVRAPAWLPWAPVPNATNVAPAPVAKVAHQPKLGLKSAVTVPGNGPPLATGPLVSPEPSAAPAPTRTEAPSSVVVLPASRALRTQLNAAGGQPHPPTVTALPALRGADQGAVQSAATEPAVPKLDPAASLFADANRARRDGNADRAIALYESLQERFPSSPEGRLSRAALAQLLLDRGNSERALANFDRYLADGTPVLSAEALVGRAHALEQLGKSEQAVAAWQQVQSRFPGSVHARLAATRLAALGMR